MIYRVGLTDEDGGHSGYFYAASTAEAVTELARNGHTLSDGFQWPPAGRTSRAACGDVFITVEAVQTPRRKGEMLRLLRWWGSHPDNG